MQEEIANTPHRNAPDFAGLLAALTAAKPTELPPWNDEELPQDVATLSYERALSKHARYKSQDVAGIDAAMPKESRTARPNVASGSTPGDRKQADELLKESAVVAPTSGRDRKCASITIRMSQTECEQLRERAAEAGLTISAYLRSCTFEAEALRAQVKQALAELRSANAPQTKPAAEKDKESENAHQSLPHLPVQTPSVPGSRLSWLRRIVPDVHSARNLVRA